MNMKDNTLSNRIAPVVDRVLVDSWSEEAIRRQLRSEAMQHPATILPFAWSILLVIYLIFYSPLLGGTLVAIILIIGSAIVAAVSFFWHYSIRYKQKFAKRVQEAMQEMQEMEEDKLEDLREALQSGFERISFSTGKKALSDLVGEYEQLQADLERRRERVALFSLDEIADLAEESYRQGLSVLADVLELTRVICSSNQEGLESEIVELEKEIESLRAAEQTARVKIRQETVALHQERLDMTKQLQLRQEQLLYQADCCEASLARTRIELAKLNADSSPKSVSAVTQALRETINQAKEVQEELKMLLGP